MSSIPTSPRPAVLAWCQSRYQNFLNRAEDIGLTIDQANTFKADTLVCATAFAARDAAKAAFEATVENSREKYSAMRRSMGGCVRSVRVFADINNDPNVYVLAQVPPPQDPSAVPPPGQPMDLNVELLSPTGAVQLRWKSNNPPGSQGTSYIVRRKMPGEAVFRLCLKTVFSCTA